MTETTNFKLKITPFGEIPWQEDFHDNMYMIDAILARYIAVTNIVGVWKNATAVTVGQRFVDSDSGAIYTVAVAHTTASTGTFETDRTTNTSYWTLFSDVDLAENWATYLSGLVNDVDYSSKAYAIGTLAQLPVGSAKRWATEAEDTEVITNLYSALHYAAKADASATAAASSASSASTSASTATTQAGIATTQATTATTQASNASTSASNAATSETNAASSASAASTSASNASTSATNAANSATAADASATSAANSASAADVAKIEWQGTYNGATTYAINDAVTYNGSSFICIQAGTGQTPAVGGTAYWDDLANKGADGAGSGDVNGPASATDNSIARFDGTTGKLIQNTTGATIDDSGNVTATSFSGDGSGLTGIASVGANIIINGDMRIAQRGTSFAAHSSGNYHLDRWGWISIGSQVVTISQDTSVVPDDQTEFSLKIDVTTADASVAAGDYAFIEYKVEGYDCLHLGQGKASPSTVTISFDVRSPKTGVHCVAIRNAASDRSYVAEFTVSSADTWESKTVTITLDTTGTWNKSNGIGMRLSWGLMVGSTYQTTANTWTAGNYFGTSSQVNCMDDTANNFYLANVKMEVGSAATDFVSDNYATSLAKCQRYYQTKGPGLGGFCVNTTTIFLTSEYAPEMRTTPTLTLLDTSPTVQDSGSSLVGSSSAISTSSSGTTGSSVQINGFTGLTADKPINTYGQTTAIYSASAEL